ncbi:hypothetical protein LINPERPRIM_LOCUS37849 [Linum perenne]
MDRVDIYFQILHAWLQKNVLNIIQKKSIRRQQLTRMDFQDTDVGTMVEQLKKVEFNLITVILFHIIDTYYSGLMHISLLNSAINQGQLNTYFSTSINPPTEPWPLSLEITIQVLLLRLIQLKLKHLWIVGI